ncbi:unnamed protein product [Rotaria sp. Silwood1]|nr:unnamed protein product [Rotaria sp. Silwood1]CAF1626155.1 unnamed protein product [Rotaria sp. Silwood1]CAF3829232.1 unnamed protein product [Rotaria sp. Silwood1]CAF4882061.1 unnamed protein product [Rotaria sp. Silwood1]
MLSRLYVPCSSLNPEDIKSLVQLCLSQEKYRVDMHGGRKAALKYLVNFQSTELNLSSYIDLKILERLKDEINQLKNIDLYKKEFDENQDDTFEPYWELKNQSRKIHQIAKANRKFTQVCFPPEQLKVYFNPAQIANIPYSHGTYESCGFVDSDARDNMIKYPIIERHNKGQINTIQGRIQQVIFSIPPEKQIIILDFADERMPGGLFLYGATTQEETICYNSNAYRALLDFKYERFDGGFMIPEFGCLYIKRAQFFKPNQPNEYRYVDIIAAACYDLTGEHGLHKRPNSPQDIEKNTEKKLETIIAAAQANSDDNGKNTYLILGPIGCGAFQNKIQTIAKLWAKVLLKPLNTNLGTEQYHVFEQIWFLSGTDEKLKVFEDAFHLDSQQRLK